MACLRLLVFSVLVTTIGFVDCCSPVRPNNSPQCPTVAPTYGPPYSHDTVYEKHNTTQAILSSASGLALSEDTSFEECRHLTAAKGAHMFIYDDTPGYKHCVMYVLYHPLCRTHKGHRTIYVNQEYMTNGTQGPGLGSLLEYWHLEPFSSFTFRIESPTILGFKDYFQFEHSPVLTTNFALATDMDDRAVVIDKGILSDPACFTSNVCSVLFQSLILVEERGMLQPKILHNICDQVITLTANETVYVLSHAEIGCKHFPAVYPVPDCSVRFSARGPVIVNATLVNFVGDNQCDGFHLFVAAGGATGSNVTNLCTSGQTEITVAGGNGNITFGGSATVQRIKYGFILKLSLVPAPPTVVPDFNSTVVPDSDST